MLEESNGEAVIVLELGPGGGDEEATKLDCCNKDTSWVNCSWDKSVLELVDTFKLDAEEEASESTWVMLLALERAYCLITLGYPCFWYQKSVVWFVW